VLDLSQIDANRMALSKQWSSLKDILLDAAATVRDFIESKGLTLKVDLPPDIPAVFCDGTRIRQVTLNLLSNAARITEQGSITTRAWIEGNSIIVSVSDTGPGIPKEDQERLFVPFQRLDNSIRANHSGSGLGLSISKRFVEMHGGKLWLESEVGRGTTFFFSIPVITAPEFTAAENRDAKRWFNPYESTDYKIRTHGFKAPAPAIIPRLVLYEKGNTFQRLLKRYLEGFEVTPVQDIAEASVELQRSPAQALIINDATLADPFSLKDNISRLPHGTPTILCRVPSDVQTSANLGIVSYLVKPVSREELLAAIDQTGSPVQTVLLVDDNQDAQRLFKRMLTSADRQFTVIRAKTGQRALSILRARKPDVMLLDLMMPGMDGFQVLQAKNHDLEIRDIPVIVISSRDPSGEPIVSDLLTVARSGGLSVRDLTGCIRSISAVLSPSGQPGSPALPGNPAGSPVSEETLLRPER